jgi:hypothetical protein
MALLILPIGVALGWFIRPPRRAAGFTVAVGLAGLAVLLISWLSGAQVSPLETVVLVIGTPIAAALAFKVAQWRLSRRPNSRSAPRTPGRGWDGDGLPW